MENEISAKSESICEKKPDMKNDKTQFEDALNIIGVGKYNYRLLAIGIYSLLAATAEMFTIGLVTTAAQCDLDLDVDKKGLLGSIPILGVVVSAHFWGFIADTRGRRYALNISTSACCVTELLAAFSTSWVYLAVFKFIGAIFASGTNALVFTLIGETTGIQKRQTYLMYAAAGVLAFQGLNIPVAYPILNMSSFSYYMPLLDYSFQPWRLYLLTIALMSGINLLLIVFFTLESPKFYFAIGEQEMGMKIMQKLYKINTGNAMDEYPVKYIVLNEDDYKPRQRNFFRSIWEQTTPLFSKKYIKSTILIFLTSLPAYCVSPPLSIWWPFIMNSVSKAQDTSIEFCKIFQMNNTKSFENSVLYNSSEIPKCDDTIAEITYIALAMFAVYLVICSLATVFIMKYIGKKWTFVIIHFICTILGVMVNYMNMYGGVFALGALSVNVTCMGIVTTYAIELFPTYMRAMAVCLTILSGRAVSIVFYNIIGAQLQNNCSNFIFILAGLIAFGGFVGIFLPSDRMKKENVKVGKGRDENDTCSST